MTGRTPFYIVLLALFLAFGSVFSARADTLYEYLNTGDTGNEYTRTTVINGQSFTATSTHDITHTKLYTAKAGSPAGTTTWAIFLADGNGHATGSALCSLTFQAEVLGTGLFWNDYNYDSPCSVIKGTKYVQLMIFPYGSTDNWINWRDQYPSTYPDGNFECSVDSGTTWTSYTDYDLMFEEWGPEATSTPPEPPATTTPAAAGIWFDNYKTEMLGLLSFFVFLYATKLIAIMAKSWVKQSRQNNI